jgi:hypothetical protein
MRRLPFLLGEHQCCGRVGMMAYRHIWLNCALTIRHRIVATASAKQLMRATIHFIATGPYIAEGAQRTAGVLVEPLTQDGSPSRVAKSHYRTQPLFGVERGAKTH